MTAGTGGAFAATSVRKWVWPGLMLFAVAAAGIWWANGGAAHNAILRADPETIANDPRLAKMALRRGRAVFEDRCAACHGQAGKGDAKIGAPDLTDRDFLYGVGRVAEIEQIVRYGIRAGDRRGYNLAYMPAYASLHPYEGEAIAPLAPGDVADVTQLLLKLGGRPADAASAARGLKIYSGRGGCYDCHGADAKGDSAIGAPNLTDDIWLFGDGSAASIAQSIAYGHKGYSPAYARSLDVFETRVVSVYVASLSGAAPPSSHSSGNP